MYYHSRTPAICLFLFYLSLPGFGEELNCVSQLSPCSCKTAQGKTIDLKALSNGAAPRFFASSSDTYIYQWDPCRQFLCKYTQASACQAGFSQFIYPIGLQSTAKFQSDSGGLFLHYDDGTSVKRNCKVYLKCNPNAKSPKYSVQGEVSTLEYQMTLEAKEACPVDNGGGGSGAGGLSVGDILLICFFLAIILYLLIGVVINIFVRKQSGPDAIPNKGFWITMPGLVKDGGKFVFTRTKQMVSKDGASYQAM